MFKQTALTSIDSYKLGHADQYPEGTTKVYSNFTARSNKYLNVPTRYKTNKIVFFGLQSFLQEMNYVWNTTFFSRDKDDVISEFVELVAPFCGSNGFNASRLEALWDLGYLPLEIKALPEGSRVNIGVPVFTITNTRKEEYWLPNFLETWLSSDLWKSSTSATISDAYRKIIDEYCEFTGANKEFVMWQGHDFSPRGMSGIKDAAVSGAGHLLSFTGSDNIPALKLINDSYRGKETFVAGSVPATEHSVMCAGGKDSELETFKCLLETYPSGVVSIVSDTWDFWNVVGLDNSLAMQLKDKILARTPDQLGLAKVVFRPDSGDPVKILTGYKSSEISYIRDPETGKEFPVYKGHLVSESEVKGAVECLWDIFGGTVNENGFKTLNQRVGLIYGDSITLERAEEILGRLAEKGFASDNVVFGIGSYTFQYNTRDTLGFAMKATYVEIEGEGLAIFKDPKTDDGMKKSARGLLQVTKQGKDFVLKSDATHEEEQNSELRTVYLDGEILVNESFADIRSRLGNL